MKGIAIHSQKKGKKPLVALPAVTENVTNVTGSETIDMKLD